MTERRPKTYSTDTQLVRQTATGEVIWTAFLSPEQYQKYMREWCRSGDHDAAIKAIYE